MKLIGMESGMPSFYSLAEASDIFGLDGKTVCVHTYKRYTTILQCSHGAPQRNRNNKFAEKILFQHRNKQKKQLWGWRLCDLQSTMASTVREAESTFGVVISMIEDSLFSHLALAAVEGGSA
jgi:hypothetical protein